MPETSLAQWSKKYLLKKVGDENITEEHLKTEINNVDEELQKMLGVVQKFNSNASVSSTCFCEKKKIIRGTRGPREHTIYVVWVACSQ